MAEQVLYRNQWQGSTPLAPALAHLTSLGGSLSTSTATALITTGLGGLNDNLVAGLTASCTIGHGTRAQTLVWTIRWDIDHRGPHVNGMFIHGGHTERFAWMSLRQDQLPGTSVDQASYGATLQRLTSDCEYNRASPNALQAGYRLTCAKNGLRHWTARLE